MNGRTEPDKKAREQKAIELLTAESRITAKIVTDILDTYRDQFEYDSGKLYDGLEIQFEPPYERLRNGPCISILGDRIKFGVYGDEDSAQSPRTTFHPLGSIRLTDGQPALEQMIGNFITNAVLRPRAALKPTPKKRTKSQVPPVIRERPILAEMPQRPSTPRIQITDAPYIPWYSWDNDP